MSNQLRSLSDSELLKELTDGLADLHDKIEALSVIVKEADRRKIDLSRLRSSLIPLLRSVYKRQLSTKALKTFFGNNLLMPKVNRLSISEQNRLSAKDAKVCVVKDGNEVEKLVTELTRSEASQVFADHRLRSASEQREYLKERACYMPKKVGESSAATVQGCRETGLVRVGRSCLEPECLIHAVEEARESLPKVRRSRSVQTKLTKTELDTLESRRDGRKVEDAVRTALRVVGLI